MERYDVRETGWSFSGKGYGKLNVRYQEQGPSDHEKLDVRETEWPFSGKGEGS